MGSNQDKDSNNPEDQENDNPQDTEYDYNQQNDQENETSQTEGDEENGQDETSTTIHEGSEAKETDEMHTSQGRRKHKVLPDISSTDLVIDEATLSGSIEEHEPYPDEEEVIPVVEEEEVFQEIPTIFPVESSSDDTIVEEEEVEDDVPDTLQEPHEFASHLFSNVLQVEEGRSSVHALKPSSGQHCPNISHIVECTEADIQTNFSAGPKSRPMRKSSLKVGKKSSSKLTAAKSSASKVAEKESSPKVTTTEGLSTSPDELRSEWEPGQDEIQVFYHYRMKSWVGSYIIGFDYWSNRKGRQKKVKEVTYNIDEGDAWYDISFKEAKSASGAIEKRRDVTMKKIEAIKMKELEEHTKLTQPGLPSTYDPMDPIDDQMKRDLRDMFAEYSKTDTYTNRYRMSLKAVDNWLERVGLLDYRHLTLIHTGLCFKAAGGSRYIGIAFEEFFTFIEMIADARNMPLQHVINRLKFAILDV